MTTPVAVQPSLPQRVVQFYHDVMVELKKVTWPDWPQVRQFSIGVILIALLVGAVIGIIDVILQAVLIRGIPSLFGG